MEKRFLDKVEDNAACEYGPRKGNKRKVTACQRDMC
ncbi:hypothetical protein Gohar_016853 [Gossypium harknessii]|uniref:Uncharacterized protein n=1 Tax=Gossypium harknessii TaxID=34285 RepID=A0A7J9G438_9ROSI|nr:hypothetical protein [Gossypium harknessii]